MESGRPWWKKGRFLLAAPIFIAWVSFNMSRRRRNLVMAEPVSVEAEQMTEETKTEPIIALSVGSDELGSREFDDQDAEFDQRRLVRRGRFVPKRHD